MNPFRFAGDMQECPFREDSEEEGLLCFDPWLDEYAKPPEDVVKNWCEKNFAACPTFLAYQQALSFKIENGFV